MSATRFSKVLFSRVSQAARLPQQFVAPTIRYYSCEYNISFLHKLCLLLIAHRRVIKRNQTRYHGHTRYNHSLAPAVAKSRTCFLHVTHLFSLSICFFPRVTLTQVIPRHCLLKRLKRLNTREQICMQYYTTSV